MITYVAFLRGISPTNPNMRNEKLRGVFEELGFSNVQTIISSGNVIFDSKSADVPGLEMKIEKALMKSLGIKSPAYVRSKDELGKIIRKNPFGDHEHGSESYLIVSFLKENPWEIFNNIDTTKSGGPEFMRDIEKKFGKNVTTRTWKTVGRIFKKMTV